MIRSVVVPIVAWGLLFTLGNMAQARPGYGGNEDSCKGCHGTANEANRPGALEVTGEGLLDLDALNGTNSDRGAIPFFTVQPGGSIDLTMNVLDGTTVYTVQIKRFGKAGVLSPFDTDFLTGYTNDSVSTWFSLVPASGVADTFFTSTAAFGAGTTWPVVPTVGPDPYTFTLTVDPNTPLNTYDLEYAVAGITLGPRFYGDKHFYLQVVPEPSTLALLGMAGLGICYLRRRH